MKILKDIVDIYVDFDRWRRDYYNLSDEDQKAIHDLIEISFPEQNYFSFAPILNILCQKQCETPLRITEIGGWKGELAKAILAECHHILSWTNIEYCHRAIKNNKCFDPRYQTWEPRQFRWWEDEITRISGDILIATHFIEHLSNQDLTSFLAEMSAGYQQIIFEAPLKEYSNSDWTNFQGTHILTLSWNEIENLLSDKYMVETKTFNNNVGFYVFKLKP